MSIFHCSVVGDYESKGLSHFAHPGLIRKIYGAHAAPYPKLNPMMSNGEIEVYMVPQGVCVHLTRAMAGGEAGLLPSSFISTIMGMTLPGSGTIFLDQYVEFKAPTFFGDTITTEVEFVGYEEKTNCYIGEFKGTCTNQRGEIVCTAICHQMMTKEIFSIE